MILTNMEVQAHEFLKHKNWIQAIDLYSKLLSNKQNTLERVISYLTDRAECFMEINNYQAVITDSKNVLKLVRDHNNDFVSLARKRLIHCLCLLKRFSEADVMARDWLIHLQESNNNQVKPLLEGILENFINCTNSKQKSFNLIKILETNFTCNSNTSLKMENRTCIYCNISFRDRLSLTEHCQTEAHEMIVMSDEGHDWYWRPPPRGSKPDSYTFCQNWRETGNCRYGEQCVQAHGEEELMEWRDRFEYREMKMKRAKETELFGKSYTEEILDKWHQSTNPTSLMQEKLDDVDDHCSGPLTATVCSKNSVHHWNFSLRTKRPLNAISLLQDTHRNHFLLSKLMLEDDEEDLQNNQEWVSTFECTDWEERPVVEYTVRVEFSTAIFGTFRQSIVFDFGSEPLLVKHLCVEVVPNSDLDKTNEIRKEIFLTVSDRWTPYNSEIIPFRSELATADHINKEWERNLNLAYPFPQIGTFQLSHTTISENKFTVNNYKHRMHELLYIEEMARYSLIARFNVTAKMQLAHSYILCPDSTAASTAKYSNNGELFSSIYLGRELSEDTPEGRLILMHCKTLYFRPSNAHNTRRVYQALIEDKGKNMIYLRLSAQTVEELGLKHNSELEVEIQFQLNRIPYCEWHYTLDRMSNFKLIFPETYQDHTVPWSPSRQWNKNLDQRLNVRQKEAILAITTPLSVRLPPILVIGPFGTGKTFTLAQAVKELIRDPQNRVLLCTHSNSAADLYIKDYLDPWVEAGNENARPLRVYYKHRWVATVHPSVQKYCLIKESGGIRSFDLPTMEDITKHKITVVTLSTSIYLAAIGVPQGYYTHILIDEAAQAIECETITPLVMAGEYTRTALAGDYMQMGPNIFSEFAKERNLHISLLERLYDHYPSPFACKILLGENYRAHKSILQFTSDSFYEEKLYTRHKQPEHPNYHPLTFFTTRGEDLQDQNSTAFYNNSEVYEVVERVVELKLNWPKEWGDYSEQGIGVVTPYSDQMFRIRSELRKRHIRDVCVERVMNVQGKQFRVVILSTVRTRRTCTNDSADADVDYGFLSNLKLLNTAMTRAQSLVAVVGDPVALCSIGRCSKVWERFIKTCNDNLSLFGITWSQLKLQLDGIELKKIYTLNPLAPEFIPRKYREMGIIPGTIKLEDVLPKDIRPLPIVIHRLHPSLPYPQPHGPLLYTVPPNMVPQPPADSNTVPAAVSQIPSAASKVVPGPVSRIPTVPNVVPPSVSILPNLSNVVAPRPVSRIVPMPNLIPSGIPQISPIVSVAQPVKPSNAPLGGPPGFLPMHVPQNGHVVGAASPLRNLSNIQNQPVIQSNNGLIQFYNNVHFPETSLMNDCVNLLPQNMCLGDMLRQPPLIQERWYNYLKTTAGLVAAEKFKYLIISTTKKGTFAFDSNIFDTPQPCDSPPFSRYGSPTSQINLHKPVYLKHIPPIGTERSPPGNVSQLSNAVSPNIWKGMPFGRPHSEVRRHINEDYANDTDIESELDKMFHALTTRNESVSDGCSSRGPRFYKYFD